MNGHDPMMGKVVLGRYRIVGPLARGGMGVVYLGRTEGAAGFSRPVVIKRILPHLLSDPEMAQMFVREARILSNLHHPGIVGVIDFGEEDSAYVMVLEYVHGYDVGLWRRYLSDINRPLATEIALHIVCRVLDALHHAHTLKRADGSPLTVVHRDVSPGNILLDVEGYVRLLDFGIARITTEADEYKTQDGTFKGKLGYAPAELLKGRPPTAQSDLYSCAIVLYQLISGTNPFRGANTPETLSRIMTLTPEPLDGTADVPPGMDKVLRRALAKDPALRYASAAEFADALRLLRRSSDSAVEAQLANEVRRDFQGAMPRKLNLVTLHSRDATWRQANPPSEQSALRSSRPAPGKALRLRSTPPSSAEPTLVEEATAATIVDGPARYSPLPASSPAPPSTSRATTLAIGALALAIGGIATVLALRPAESDSASRYVVISKTEDNSAPIPSLSANPAPRPSSELERTGPGPGEAAKHQGNGPSKPKPPAKSRTAESKTAKKPDPAQLTRTFSRRQGRVQGCFKSNPEQAEKTSSLQIAFSVSSGGSVTKATLAPSGLESTRLGRCILSVARSTQFGRLTESVSFRIPVQARRR